MLHAVVHIEQHHEANEERYERVQQVEGQVGLNEGPEVACRPVPVDPVVEERLEDVEKDDADDDPGEQASIAVEVGCYVREAA